MCLMVLPLNHFLRIHVVNFEILWIMIFLDGRYLLLKSDLAALGCWLNHYFSTYELFFTLVHLIGPAAMKLGKGKAQCLLFCILFHWCNCYENCRLNLLLVIIIPSLKPKDEDCNSTQRSFHFFLNTNQLKLAPKWNHREHIHFLSIPLDHPRIISTSSLVAVGKNIVSLYTYSLGKIILK